MYSNSPVGHGSFKQAACHWVVTGQVFDRGLVGLVKKSGGALIVSVLADFLDYEGLESVAENRDVQLKTKS